MLTANKWHYIPAKNDIFRLALTGGRKREKSRKQ
jgi:hypothetical protein